MRKIVVVLALAAAVVLAAAGPAGGDRAATRANVPARLSVPGRLSVRVPAGWHALRGWLSDVTDPAPRLAVASFPARLSRHTCECGFPNVLGFPRKGAFVFVWEYLHAARGQLVSTPARPARFSVAPGRAVHLTCDGPADGFSFKQAGRVFQVEVYIGPDAGRALRARVAAMLDTLRVAPET